MTLIMKIVSHWPSNVFKFTTADSTCQSQLLIYTFKRNFFMLRNINVYKISGILTLPVAKIFQKTKLNVL